MMTVLTTLSIVITNTTATNVICETWDLSKAASTFTLIRIAAVLVCSLHTQHDTKTTETRGTAADTKIAATAFQDMETPKATLPVKANQLKDSEKLNNRRSVCGNIRH
jgi:hypothetical protein